MRQSATAMAVAAPARPPEHTNHARKSMASGGERSTSAPNIFAINYPALVRFTLLVGGLCLFYLSGCLISGEEWLQIVNCVGPGVLFVGCVWTAFVIVRANSLTLWTPMPWFITSSGLFFGIGALAYPFGNDEMIADMDAFHCVNIEELWSTNLLNAIGIFVITISFLASSKFADRFARKDLVHQPASLNRVRAEISVYVFLGIGLPLQYLLILPHEFAKLDFVLPGVIQSLSNLVSLGVFMLAYLAVGSGGRWRVFFWLLFSSELFVQLLCFNKEAFLMTLIMTVLGRYLARRKMSELILGAALASVVYVLLVPLVTWGREEIERQHGEYNRASLGERISVIKKWIDLRSSDNLERERQGGWWTRLSYTNVEALGMNLYDRGHSGDTFTLCVYGLVPRFIWPDKPVIDPGADFTEMVLGFRESRTGIGVIGEAYWNGGWILVLFACCYVGMLYTWLSRMALLSLVRSEWLLLPCAFMGVRLGFRIDDWFTSYVSGILIYLFYFLLIRLIVGKTRPESKDMPIA